jgi:hypothetical protein
MNYYFPFTYAWASRSKTILEKLSFFVIFIFPSVFASCFFGVGLNFEQFIIEYIIAMITFYSFYEIFYIINDVYTVKHELSPTYRFSNEKQIILEQKAPALIWVRIFFLIMGIILLASFKSNNYLYFIFILFIVGVLYVIHNFFRSRINIISYFFLTTIRYIAVPMLFIKPEYRLIGFVSLFFSFPLLRAIEKAGQPKFKLFYSKFLNNDKFRVWYYGFDIILAIVLVWFVDKAFEGMLMLGMWFLFYRVAILFVLSIDKIKIRYRQ